MRKQNQGRDPRTTQVYLSFSSRKKKKTQILEVLWSCVSFKEGKEHLPFPKELSCFSQV